MKPNVRQTREKIVLKKKQTKCNWRNETERELLCNELLCPWSIQTNRCNYRCRRRCSACYCRHSIRSTLVCAQTYASACKHPVDGIHQVPINSNTLDLKRDAERRRKREKKVANSEHQTESTVCECAASMRESKKSEQIPKTEHRQRHSISNQPTESMWTRDWCFFALH